MTIAIVGLGLIGGSVSLALKAAGAVSHVIGIDAQPDHAAMALSLGLADEIAPLEEACARSEAVIVAIPVDKSKPVLDKVLEAVGPAAVVIDMGSTKNGICAHLANNPRRAQFVAAHPMAGTEYSGPTAAHATLLKGKRLVVCEKDKSSDAAFTKAIVLFQALEMKLSFMDAPSHDRHAAYISHLSHITSFTLGLAVLEAEKDDACILDMAGSGFASTVRLAKSSPDMWRPIFMENKARILEALEHYTKQLDTFRRAIEASDGPELDALMRRANDIGRILDK